MQLGERPTDQLRPPEVTERFYDRTGPETPAGRYLRRFWIPVAVLDDVKPGRAKTITIMDERFTYYRGETGTPHVLAAECAHRHASLAPTGIVEGDCLRCFYHGWKYDASGQCLEQPAEGAIDFAHKVQIKSYPVRLYVGLVFAYLGEGEPPEFQELHVLHGEGVLHTDAYVRKTNFFNSLDNSADWAHVNFVHERSAFTTTGINREVPTVTAEETAFGLTGYCAYTDGVVGLNYILMPICMYIMAVHEDPAAPITLIHHLAWRVPIDDNTHRSFNVRLAEVTGERARQFRESLQSSHEILATFPSRQSVLDSIYRGDIHINEVDEARPDIIGMQDTVTMEMQRPISRREPDRLGKSDAAVILLRRIYMREIRNMLDGKPLKEWVWPPDIRAVSQVATSS